MKLEYNKEITEVILKYTRRKSIGIKVRPPGEVVVHAPVGMPEGLIREVLVEKREWIFRKLSDVQTRQSKTIQHTYASGDRFYYLGKPYTLCVEEVFFVKKPVVNITDGDLRVMVPSSTPEEIKKALHMWYKLQAERVINERINYYKTFFTVEPSAIQVKEQKKRWGSCSSKRKLMFNWRIVMAPMDVLDYIVVHEMCHMVHMNHSSVYWALVKSIMPDYKEKQTWLKENGLMLTL